MSKGKGISEMLHEYPQQKVNQYIDYLGGLKTEKTKNKNTGKFELKKPWASKLSDDYYISIFKKVAQDGVYIEGDTISLTPLGATYDYNAYKNILLVKYPETTFDMQVVYDVDKFTFEKEDGKIWYKHTINNAFSTSKKIVGAYCIIKNKRGQFLETINLDDIKKFKNSSKMGFIWSQWEDRMVLKSVIKRICKSAFYDIVSSAYIEDNKHSDPNNCTVDSTLQEKIEKAQTRKELAALFKDSYKKDRAIVKLFKAVRERIASNPTTKLEIDEKNLNLAIGNIITGELEKDDFLSKYHLTEKQEVYFNNSINGK